MVVFFAIDMLWQRRAIDKYKFQGTVSGVFWAQGRKRLNIEYAIRFARDNLLASITELIGLSVYTEGSQHVGTVTDIIIDTEKYCVDSVYIEKPNPLLVENSIAIGVPFRWIGAVGDIVILRHFPRYIRTGGKKQEPVKKQRKLAGGEVDEIA